MPAPRDENQALDTPDASCTAAASRAPGINPSATTEPGSGELTHTRRRQAWMTANTAAIAAYNRDVDAHGSFADGAKTF